MGKTKGQQKIGRDAGTGKFIPVKEAQQRKRTAVVETIRKDRKPR
jgi:ribosomal protein L19E